MLPKRQQPAKHCPPHTLCNPKRRSPQRPIDSWNTCINPPQAGITILAQSYLSYHLNFCQTLYSFLVQTVKCPFKRFAAQMAVVTIQYLIIFFNGRKRAACRDWENHYGRRLRCVRLSPSPSNIPACSISSSPARHTRQQISFSRRQGLLQLPHMMPCCRSCPVHCLLNRLAIM